MSLNIQTANGLLEIGGNVTKEKVISALGYEPANKTHISDTSLHVTSEERETWNNKSDFSGAYADLIDAPSITETESGNMVVADENGNIIMQVDADGFETTNVSAKTIELNGKDLGERLDELEATSLPNILDNETGDLTVSDGSGNVIMKVDGGGLETTTVTAKFAVIDGIDISVKLDEHAESIDDVNKVLSSHKTNSTIHITADERTLWNNKSDFSGDFNDLTNAPDIKEDESGEVVYADEAGNVIVKIGETGLETTQVIANSIVANGVNVGSAISSHAGNNAIHITSEERVAWNDKASTVYVDKRIADLVDSSPETLNTLNELAAALGDDPNFAATVANQIGLKADKTSLDTHASNTTIHVTASEKATWDSKSDFSGDYNDLENAPNIVDDGSKSVVYADEAGNIIARIDANGFESTTITSKSVIVNGVNVETKFDEIKNNFDSHVDDGITHITSDERTAWNAKADKTYVDSEVSKKADSNHTHNQYLEADDIAGKADKTYVDTELAKKANASHVHDEYLEASDIANKADKSYVDSELAQKANSNHTHDQYLVSNDIANKADKSYVDEELAEKVDKVEGSRLITASEASKLESLVLGDNGQVEISGKVNVNNVEGLDEKLALKADADHTHEEHLVAEDIANKADKSYVDEELAAAIDDVKTDVANQDTVVLFEAQKAVDAVRTYVDEELVKKSNSDHTHEQYLTSENIANKADKSELHEHSNKDELDKITSGKVAIWDAKADKTYVDEQLDAKANTNHAHEQYLVASDISGKADTTYVNTELAKKAESAEISHSTETTAESATIKDGKLSIVIDAYTKSETLNKIQEKITEINGGESAGEVLGALNSYKETNNARVGAIEEKNNAQDDVISQVQQSVSGKAEKTYVDEELARSIAEAKTDAANKDAVVLFEAQNSINAVRDALESEIELRAYASAVGQKVYSQPEEPMDAPDGSIWIDTDEADSFSFAEDWVFTLDDGSTVTKKVMLVGDSGSSNVGNYEEWTFMLTDGTTVTKKVVVA